jgi:DNA-binding NtrC family response regulator
MRSMAKNAIERMVILYDGPTLRAGWWEPPKPARFMGQANLNPRAGQFRGAAAGGGIPAETAIPYTPAMSRKQRLELAAKLLAEGGHDLTWVAAQVGVNSSTLYRWRKANRI